MSKQIKILKKYNTWEVIRIGDEKRGDYLLARLFDELSAETFVNAMVLRGFVLLVQEDESWSPVERHVFMGTIQYDSELEEYYYELTNGTRYTSETFMLFEELDNLMKSQGLALSEVGDRLTIVVDRKRS